VIAIQLLMPPLPSQLPLGRHVSWGEVHIDLYPHSLAQRTRVSTEAIGFLN